MTHFPAHTTVGEALTDLHSMMRDPFRITDIEHMEYIQALKAALSKFSPGTALMDPQVQAAKRQAMDDLNAMRTQRKLREYAHLDGIVEKTTVEKLTLGGRKPGDQELLLAQLIVEMSAFRKAMGVPPA